MALQDLSIIGVGLLGGSIALAAKSALNDIHIRGYDKNAESLDAALRGGALDSAGTNLADAVAHGDLIVLCTPVGQFEPILRQIGPLLKAGAIVTDVGSTKRSVVQLAHKILPSTAKFVGSHPIAGGSQNGWAAARNDLLRDALCITTPTIETDPKALETIESFWRALQMRVKRLTPDLHDALLARASHLPHAVAAGLLLAQSAQSLTVAGRGLRDTTRIAAGDAELWRDIFLDNSEPLFAGLTELIAQLQTLQSALKGRDHTAVQAWLAHAARLRQQLD